MSGQEITLSKEIIKNCTQNENKVLITQSVLEACQTGKQADMSICGEVEVLEARLLDNDNFYILVLVCFDKKNTLAVVYEETSELYKVFAVLGHFYEIAEVKFILEPISKNTMILLREKVDMAMGVYETSEWLKGYLWNGKFYYQVLNIPFNIKAYWNNAWIAYDKNKQWEKVEQNCNYTWDNIDKIVLYLYKAQEYSISNVEGSVDLPDDNTFQTVRSRFVVEAYNWSRVWNCFILYEGRYKVTGQTVAVIIDLSKYVYSLVEPVSQRYVIYTSENEYLVIPDKDLEPLT